MYLARSGAWPFSIVTLVTEVVPTSNGVQSQTEQSWKAARTVEEAQVRGLVAGDCGGENTTDAYRKQMNQNRKGYMSEPIISNAMCGEYHPTLQ